MRELNVRLIMCFALLFATTSGAGCASQPPAAGCSGQCASSPGQGPTNPILNNDAELNGNYAFTFSGITGNGSVSSVFAAVGRFTADGAGNLTNGELETNGVGARAALAGSIVYRDLFDWCRQSRCDDYEYSGQLGEVRLRDDRHRRRPVNRVRRFGRGGNGRLGDHGKGGHHSL